MYFPIGWPKAVNLSLPGESCDVKHICFDAVKILVAAVGANFLGIWYANPLIPIVYYKRSVESVDKYGESKFVIWKPDSRQMLVLTCSGIFILYQVDFEATGNGIFQQVDPPMYSLKRDSAELFIKENIPKLSLMEVCHIQLNSRVTTVCCTSLTELLIATQNSELIRVQWSELVLENFRDLDSTSTIDLRQVEFYVNQQCNLKNVPPIRHDSYVASLEYSPFIGGCAAVFSDKRAAFLIANHLRFEAESMHGFWIPEVEDATVCSVNHKFRLLAYGRSNSDVSVYAIEDTTGGLEFSHRLSLNAIVMPGTLGAVNEMKWSPDGCVLVVAWKNGGIALWSTFGALLMSSFSWDFGVHIDLLQDNPLCVNKLEWSTEGYQLLLTCEPQKCESSVNEIHSNVLQLNFVKSALTMNPCMTSHPHILIQGDDTLYLNQGDNIEKIYFGNKIVFPNSKSEEHPETEEVNQIGDDCVEIKNEVAVSSILSENKYWTVVQLPQTYAATNWPIRYSAIDDEGFHIAVAGRTGLAHYSILTKKWKLFGNESQEKDFVVSGGLLWWKGFIVCGCYSLLDRTDQVRCYPEESKLDNQYGNRIQVRAPVISLNMFRDQLIALTADGIVTLFAMRKCNAFILQANCVYEVDVKSICIHPACIVSLTVTNLRNDLTAKVLVSTGSSDAAETIIVNVCGRILMIQRDNSNIVVNSLMASCLASCVECFWLSNTSQESSPMKDCLWLFSGVHGMRVWLPILPPSNEPKREGSHRLHTFMSKRIMLSFPLKLYPLVILFDNVMVLGVENETTLYSSETNSHFSLPFSQLSRKSQVYLHMILRQLIKRNLGYSAWEIAQSCCHLPYFPHSLELLLHEVLEEEATSKEPIPDALLPSILDFIREFPVYLQTIVQCARKTEIALWPYLFSMAGKPKDLFQQCLESQELVTAASYLIILQNLEPSFISRQYATLLLEIALQYRNWELAKDLIRFLKAIDPNEIDSPRSSMVVNVKIAPPSQAQSQVNQNPDAFNLVLGPIARERSFSTTGLASTANKEKKDKISAANVGANNESSTLNSANVTQAVIRRKSERSNSAKNEKRENFCIETILYRHARKLLQNCKLIDLGYMSAFLDFHLVSWLSQEADKSGRLENYVAAINLLHEELKLPTPVTFYSLSEESDQDYNQMQKRFQLDRDMKCLHTSSQTSESGYFSLSLMDTATSVQNGNTTNYANIPSIKENEELQYSSLMQTTQHPVQLSSDCNKSRSNSQTSLDHNTLYRRFYPLNAEMSSSLTLASNYTEIHHKILPEKMAIKMRYLLQLFIEANCIDFALVLSILLQDAASIGRIINVLIRSETVTACSRVQTSLKQVAQWSFDSECIYRSFMISLQPHIFLLDQFIQSSSVSLTVAQPTVGAVNNVQCILNPTRNSDSSDQKDSIKCGEHQTSPLNNSHGMHSAVGNSMKIGNWSYDKYRAEDKCNILSRQLSNESASHSCPSSREKSMENARSFSYDHQDVNRNETSGCIVM